MTEAISFLVTVMATLFWCLWLFGPEWLNVIIKEYSDLLGESIGRGRVGEVHN